MRKLFKNLFPWFVLTILSVISFRGYYLHKQLQSDLPLYKVEYRDNIGNIETDFTHTIQRDSTFGFLVYQNEFGIETRIDGTHVKIIKIK